ncbi:MAG: hypothetical protein HY796_10920, partial [Elusimicrobia bacterium]|nr:hypothetical protein [Elusimicrobiota bacterium]
VAGRAMIFSEPYENLGRLRWLPIGAQLVSLLGVYLPYRGLAKRGPVSEEEAMVPLAVYAGCLFLLIFHIGHYGGETSRPLVFTGCYLALFACGVLRSDTPLRAAWLLLLPVAIIAYVNPMPKFPSLLYNFAYAAAISAGMYIVYIFSESLLKQALSRPEKKSLPALCLASAIILLLSADHYAPGTFKTAAAALCLFALYLAGAGLRDDMLAICWRSAALSLCPIFLCEGSAMTAMPGSGPWSNGARSYRRRRRFWGCIGRN